MVANPPTYNRRQMILAGLGAVTAVVSGPLAVNRGGAQTPGPVELRPKTGFIRLGGGEGAEGLPMVGYGGSAPGPLIVARRGEEIAAQLINDWSEPTLVHWHGLRVPSEIDGFPFLSRTPIGSGQNLAMRLPTKDAGTFWYHATPASQFSRGLSGPLIINESEPIDVDRDLMLILQDWQAARASAPTLTINGKEQPSLQVRRGERVRLRLINATAGRVLSIQLPEQPAWVMAIDGQPAEPFIAKDSRVMIAPGNRLDLFVDITADGGTSDIPVLVETANTAPVPGALLVIEGERPGPRRDGVPSALPANPLPAQIDLRNAVRISADLSAGAQTASSTSRKQAPKGLQMLEWRPLPNSVDAVGSPAFTIQRGRTVTAMFTNPGSRAAVIHTHGHSFRLLDNLDDGWKPFWLDTLLVAPQQTARIAFRADAAGRWAITARPLADPNDEWWTWFQAS